MSRNKIFKCLWSRRVRNFVTLSCFSNKKPGTLQSSSQSSWFYGSGTVQNTMWSLGNFDPPFKSNEIFEIPHSRLNTWCPGVNWNDTPQHAE